MRNTKKVNDLEKEVQELRLKITSLEEGLKNAEKYINSLKNSGPLSPTEVPTNSNDKNDNSEVSIIVVDNTNSAKQLSKASSSQQDNLSKASSTKKKNTKIVPLISFNPEDIPLIHYVPDNKNKSLSNVSQQNNVSKEEDTTQQDNLSNASPAKKKKAESVPLINLIPDNQSNITEDESIKTEESDEDSKTESWVGKILMGALASILVFIALITFAKVLLPYLTDTMKIILMFIASFALTGTGFGFNKKKPENTFFKALLACGSACIYISIMMTGIYFKAVSSMVMYVLIALWAVLNIFFKKGENDWLFFTVGNLGYLVSIIFTAGLHDNSLIIPLLIYVIMISVVYQIMYWKNERQRYAQNIINILSLLLFQVIMKMTFRKITEVITVEIVAMAITFIGFIVYTVSDLFSYKKIHFYMAVVNSLAYFMTYVLLMSTLRNNNDNEYIISFTVVIIPAIVFEFINMYWKIKKLTENETYVNACYSVFLFSIAGLILAMGNNFIFYTGILMLAYSIIVVYGIIKKDIFFKIQGWALVCICMVMEIKIDHFRSNMTFTVVATVLSLTSLIVEGIVLNDSEPFKIVSYLLFLGWIVRIGYKIDELRLISIESEVLLIVLYGLIALINSVMILVKFYKTKGKDEEGKNIRVVLDILNLVFIIFGGGMMNAARDITFRIIYTIIVYILSCINIPLKDKGSRERYMYTAVKFAALIYYTLWNYNTPNFVISISMIAIAVVCIVIGFKNRLIGKELRIFGLVMTLIFVIKFIIIDIHYDSSMLKALSYLISGMLCFGISALYNYFEKKGKKSE